MGFYGRWVFPTLLNRALRSEDAAACRQNVVTLARGCVLEIGIGSGLNLPYYGPEVDVVVGVDPSAELLKMTKQRTSGPRALYLLQASAEAIPLLQATIDTAVMTWTLCSVADPRRVLEEVRRVLRPEGRLLFIEHGLAPDAKVARWQRRFDPFWQRISCRLDRPVDRLLADAGFVVGEITTGYVGQGPRFVSFMYQGWAMPDAPGCERERGLAGYGASTVQQGGRTPRREDSNATFGET